MKTASPPTKRARGRAVPARTANRVATALCWSVLLFLGSGSTAWAAWHGRATTPAAAPSLGAAAPAASGLANASGAVSATLGFAGELSLDPCLVNLRARVYNTCLGRFLQRDELDTAATAYHDPQQANRYAYVANQPVNRIDPSGHQAMMPSTIGGVGSTYAASLEQLRQQLLRTHQQRNQFNRCPRYQPQKKCQWGLC